MAAVVHFPRRHPSLSVQATRGCRRGLRFAWRPLVIAWLCVAQMGCSRQYWREQADAKTYPAIGERFVDPRWTLPRTDLTPDPYSRFYDPYDPDCGPLPPDDPAAHQYMHCVYGMRGSAHWHEFGDLRSVENPDWLQPYGGSPEVVDANYGHPAFLPEVKNLTLEESLGLAYRHSQDFQNELENVYLNALGLTSQRFRFDTQFFGIGGRPPSADLTHTLGDSQSDLNLDTRAGVNKLLPTGAQLAAELANNTVWLFSGPNTSATQSVLSYSIVQPLLRDGGRKFALESLTQAERDMLYAVRDFARYRMGFFTNVVAGTRSSAGVSGVGGGFGQSQDGYLGLLQLYQTIENQRFNIRLQEQQAEILRAQAERPAELNAILEALPQGVVIPPELSPKLRYDPQRKLLILRGDLTPAELAAARALTEDAEFRAALAELMDIASTSFITRDLAQIETRLPNSRIQLANSLQQYQTALEQYTISLGLPPDMSVSLDTTMLRPFQLIDPRLVALQDAFRFYVRAVTVTDEQDPEQELLMAASEQLYSLDQRFRQDAIDVLASDLEQAAAALDMQSQDDEVTDVPAYDPARDRQLFKDLQARLLEAESLLSEVRGKLSQPNASVQDRRRAREVLLDLREEFLRISQGLALIQIDVRLELIPLNDFSMPLEEATAIALENRHDLMNVRAVVMDARRKIEVAANQLESVLDIRAEGDVRTRSIAQLNDNPLDFREDSSDYRVGVSFTTPIQLIGERNDYRAALIDYQRARRQYMRAEDQVKFSVRNAWRQLTTLKQNFKRAKYATRISALQYDQTADLTSAPRAGGAVGGLGGQNQGLQLLQAFDSILTAQNRLIQIWVDYETNRLNIYRDMGTMVIDDRGFWIDSYYQDRLAKAGQVTLPELRETGYPVLSVVPAATSDASLPEGSEPTTPNGVEFSTPSPDGPLAPPDASPQELPNGPALPPDPGPDLPPQPAEARTRTSARGLARKPPFDARRPSQGRPQPARAASRRE